MLDLAAFGSRIAIIGASNGGKSTLAAAIGRYLELPVIHLDQLYHQPHTNWEPRPTEEFYRLHDEAMAGDSWIIEGNYSSRMAQRFERATSAIWLDTAPVPSAMRYVRRTLFDDARFGNLEGARERLNWRLFRYILVEQPRQRPRYAALLAQQSFPVIRIKSMRELRSCYRHWSLHAAL
jgi:adenylate kinase family enzyme